jgi:hypothetical protein
LRLRHRRLSSTAHNNQPYPSTMDDYSYLDSLGGRQMSSRGNHARDSPNEEENEDNRFSNRRVSFETDPRAMAATPPSFRTRSNTIRQGSRSNTPANSRDSYWKNNHPVNVQKDWSSIRIHLPQIAPIAEATKIKNAIFTSLDNKLSAAEGDWKDKTELLAALFEDTVPAATMQANIAISDMDSYLAPVYTFSDMEILDSTFRALNVGNALDYPAASRQRARFFRFTLTVNPRLTNTRDLDLDTTSFPSQVTTTAYARMLTDNNGEMHPVITKQLAENTPKLLYTIYEAQAQEFVIAQKHYLSAAPDPDKQKKWLAEIKGEGKISSVDTAHPKTLHRKIGGY